MSFWITMDQLRVGLFVQLDLPWLEHPFGFNSFKIKTEDQIEVLRQLGLQKIRYDPNRSSVEPLPPPAESAQPEPPPSIGLTVDHPAIQAKQARVEYLKHYRDAVARAEAALHDAAQTLRGIKAKLESRPEEARAEAEALIEHLVDTLLAEPDATLHAMADKPSGDDPYYHELNVTVLSLIMANGLGLSPAEGKVLGLGALFHDVGLREVPAEILRKAAPLTESEVEQQRAHCPIGVGLGERLGLPRAALDIIGQHHELRDGSGYPAGLRGEEIAPLARLVEVASRYDRLCNPIESDPAMSPHEALSFMFAQQRGKHDPTMMRVLIRCLGVYPPGTVVHLSNGAIARVTSVNPARPLKPTLVVYEPDVPKEEAIVIDLGQEPEVHIGYAIQPAQLPRAVCDYLGLHRQISYYLGKAGMLAA